MESKKVVEDIELIMFAVVGATFSALLYMLISRDISDKRYPWYIGFALFSCILIIGCLFGLWIATALKLNNYGAGAVSGMCVLFVRSMAELIIKDPIGVITKIKQIWKK